MRVKYVGMFVSKTKIFSLAGRGFRGFRRLIPHSNIIVFIRMTVTRGVNFDTELLELYEAHHVV